MADFSSQSNGKKERHPFRRGLQNVLLTVVLRILFLTVAGRSLGFTRWLAGLLARLAALFLRGTCRTIEANLAVAFPELSRKERQALRQRNLRYLMETGLDILSMMKDNRWAKGKVVGLPPESEVTGDKVILWNLPHFGNWEVLAQSFPLSGCRCAAVVAKFGLEVMDRLLSKCRRLYGLQLIPQDGASLGMKEALESGIHTGILIDQNTSPRHGGIFVPFFGLPAATSRLPASMARYMDCKIGIISCHKREDGKYEINYHFLPHTGAWYEDDLSLTCELLRCDEEIIRKHPEQYLWLYRRWRYRPANVTGELESRYPYYSAKSKAACAEEILTK